MPSIEATTTSSTSGTRPTTTVSENEQREHDLNDSSNGHRNRSRSRDVSTSRKSSVNTTNRNQLKQSTTGENDLPLSFASFYYSLKVLRGKDEREDVQKKTFAKWINVQLSKINEEPMRDLFHDLKDGTILLKLLELLTGKELKKEIGNMKVHHLGNVNIVLSTLRDYKIRLINISANDIVEGNPKLTLGLVWNIIQHWQVRDVLRSAVYDIHTTNLEKALLTWCQNSTRGYAGVDVKNFTDSWKDGLAFNALIHRYRPNLFNYDELYKNRNKMSPLKFAETNLEHAFDLAQKNLQIERLLDTEDVITEYPDKKSIMMYVMCYFQVLSKLKTTIIDDKDGTKNSNEFKLATSKSDKATLTPSFSFQNLNFDTVSTSSSSTTHKLKQQHQPQQQQSHDLASLPNQKLQQQRGEEEEETATNKIDSSLVDLNKNNDNLDTKSLKTPTTYTVSMSVSSSSSATTSAASPILEAYLGDLKKVIEWLAASESVLINQSDIGHDVNLVKQQFQTHEDFMLELTKHQNNVGLVLQEGSRLINSGTISADDDLEIRKQMKLLNDMWENLRLQAVDRQAKLHERLMKLQTEQLNQMDQWLSLAEQRIQKISQLPDSLDGLVEQKEELSRLQDDLVKEQEAVDCLKQIIVVVDDNTDDQSFTDLENKLSNLSDRWSNVCKFVGNRWFTVQELILKLQSIDSDFDELNAWIGNKSLQLDNLIKRTTPLARKYQITVSGKQSSEGEDLPESEKIESSIQLIKILKEVEIEMQAMHTKLNEMNEIGEQIGTQLNNSPQLSNSINQKMDILESKWNSLLEQMEYLSKICTELQQVEILRHASVPLKAQQSVLTSTTTTSTTTTSQQEYSTVVESIESIIKKRRVQTEEIKNFTNIDLFVTQLNKVFDTVKAILSNDNLNKDDPNEAIIKAQAEIHSNEYLLENMNIVGNSLIDDIKSKNGDTSEIERKLNGINAQWSEMKTYVDELAKNTEKNFLSRKAAEELATLRDVHEGYQKYINNAEPLLTNDPQKLNLQSETNRVKLKGMNSYEPRLNELKRLTTQLDNKELISDIDNFALRWNETYSLINSRNEEIYRNFSTVGSSSLVDKNESNNIFVQEQQQRQQIGSTTDMSYISTNNAATTSESSSSRYVTSTHKHKIENIESSGSSAGSDEDVLHVVTNVYTIPIIKSNSDGAGPFIQQSQSEIHVSTSLDDDFMNSACSAGNYRQHHHHQEHVSATAVPIILGEPHLEMQSKTTTHESRKIVKRVVDSSCGDDHEFHEHHYEQQPVVTSMTGQDFTKSKFQIRSIVEIYENELDAAAAAAESSSHATENDNMTGYFKTSTQLNETTTKEVINQPIIRDDRQTSIKLEETSHSTKSYMELSQSITEWISNLERTISSNDVQLNFLSVLEDRLQAFKDISNELKDKRTNLDYMQRIADDFYATSITETSIEIRNDAKSVKNRYQILVESINERINKLEKLIGDLREYQEEYLNNVNRLKNIETNLQIEHHSSQPYGSTYGKTLEEQLNNLKQVKYDLETQSASINRLNERAQKYLYSTNADLKFTTKMRTDINEINEKLNQLRSVCIKKQYVLDDALSKSTKVDNELDELENWIAYKEHEILEDEGIIITEEQFDQRTIKYKQLKSEIDRKEVAIKNLLDAGNDMLKSTTNSLSNVNELAKNMMSINTKWSNLNKKVDNKNRLFAQSADQINELRQLLHQENTWLNKVQEKLNSSKLGGDAEELSEELDSIERFLKSHSSHTKERINELSTQLIEKNILIQLANSDVKEFLFKWQLLHDEANKKLKMLDTAINDVQNWERRLLELQDWVNYMDKYLSTRIDQDIFADDVPEDFARIQEEFYQNELVLKELDESIERFKLQGKSESASRLDQQLNIMKKNWHDLAHKFKKFQKPADFDQKLNKVRKQLDDIDQAMYMIEINNEDPDTIHLQLEHCMKFYKTLSELKPQIEFVLKQGRSIVDKRQVDNTDELTRQLDSLKFKYNELGSRVTNGKNDLEKAFKVAKKFRKEYSIINDFLGKIDGELRKIEQKPLSKNYNDELDWIKNTKIEINKVENVNLETMRSLKRSLEEIVRAKATSSMTGGAPGGMSPVTVASRLTSATSKITDIEQKVINIQRRIDDRATFLNDQARKLDESYEIFLARNRQILITIETLQHELIDAERVNSRETFDKIEREVNTLLSDVEMIRAQGTDLCSKSEQYSKVVETELRTLITNFEDLNRRLNLAQERVVSTSANQENITTTVTTTATTKQSKHTQESKYTRSRRTKSPSESSVDSTVDVFDSELKQKYMRAVAYLRILDEAPIVENDSTVESQYRYEKSDTYATERASRNEAIDIDFVIQQAKQVAQMNEASNPERARRILEKVHKLEQRWTATKSKRDSLKSSSKLYEKYKEKEGNLNDQIHILEQFSIHKMKETRCDDEYKEELVYKYKTILREIEELQIEEILLNEIILIEVQIQTEQRTEHPQSQQKPTKDQFAYKSVDYYHKWKLLAEKSNIYDELAEYVHEAVSYFEPDIDKYSQFKTNHSEMSTITSSASIPINLTKTSSTDVDQLTAASATAAMQTSKSDSRVGDSTTITASKQSKEDATENLKQMNEQPVGFNGLGEPVEFIKCLEKLISSTSIVDKHLDNIQKLNREFVEFEKQDLKLNAIKQTLESLASALKTSLLHKNEIMDKSNKETAKKIGKLIATLTTIHQNVVDKYKNKSAIYIKNNDKWNEFNKDYATITEWLDSTLLKVGNLKETSLENEKLKEVIKDFSNLTSNRLLLERTNLNGHEILLKSNEHEAKVLSEKMNDVNQKWKNLISLLNELKENYASKNVQQQSQTNVQPAQAATNKSEPEPYDILCRKFNEHNEWLNKCFQTLDKDVSPVDELENNRFIFEIKELENELPYHQSIFENDYKKFYYKLKKSNELDSMNAASTEIFNRFSKVKEQLAHKKHTLETNLQQLKQFQDDLNKMNNWIDNLNLDLIKLGNGTHKKTDISNSKAVVVVESTAQGDRPHSPDSCRSSSPSPSTSSINLLDSNSLKAIINAKLNHFEALKSTYGSLNAKSNAKMPNFLMDKMENLIKKWTDLDFSMSSSGPTQTVASTAAAAATAEKPSSANQQTDLTPTKEENKPQPEVQDDEAAQEEEEDEMEEEEKELNEALENMIQDGMTDKTTMQTVSILKERNVILDDGEFSDDENRQQSSTPPQAQISDMKHEMAVMGFRKASSIDSIKSKTIVTPIDLETHDDDQIAADLRKELNIIKLENENIDANIVSLDESTEKFVDNRKVKESTSTHSLNKLAASSSVGGANKKINGGDSSSSTGVQSSSSYNLSEKEDIQLISNDLFDWLLWIDHTLETQLVTIGDMEQIQQSINKYNSILNEVNNKQDQLEKLLMIIDDQIDDLNSANLSSSSNKSSIKASVVPINDRLKQLKIQWRESTNKVVDRKEKLECMLRECEKLHTMNEQFSSRMLDMEQKVDDLPELSLGKDTLKRQKTDYKKIKQEFNQLKDFFLELKSLNDTIIDNYKSDDNGKIKTKFDRLSQRFDELTHKLHSHGDGISDALQTIDDFDVQLVDFSQWLYKIEQDLNYLEDYCLKSDDTNSTKQTVIELYQELQKEIDNHNGAYSNLTETSDKILESLKNQSEKDNLRGQLDEINRRWSLLRKKSLEIRSRLESNSAQWSALLNSLKELIQWCKTQQQEIFIRKQNLQPDINLVCKQINENKIFMCNIEYKKSIIESTLASAKLYYDDRVKSIDLTANNLAADGAANAGAKKEPAIATTPTAATTPTSTSSSLFGLRKKLSSKKKKEKKSSLQELKIKEDTEKESPVGDAADSNHYDLTDHNLHHQQHQQHDYEDNLDLMDDNLVDDEFDLLLNGNTNMTPNELATHLINKIDRKVQLLDRLWQELNRQSLNYNNMLINFYNNLQLLYKSFELVNQKLNQHEQQAAKINIVNQIESDKLAEELEIVKNFQLKISSYQPLIDNMCTHYANIIQELQQCGSVYIRNQQQSIIDQINMSSSGTTSMTAKFDDLNLRWSNLQNLLQENYLHLYSLIESSGADIFIKLADSVQSPWQRAVSANNKIPYYINHATEITSWDHPKMIDLYKSFTNLNDIRFSAYRTAMKLRTLQKRLWLDFVDINDAIDAFDKHGLKSQNERNLDTTQVIQFLNRLFQPAVKQNSQLIDLVLAVDLTLNWLLCVYDQSRCGQVRLLSLKTAIILLCKGSIEDKYIFLYNLVGDNKGLCTHRKLGMLLYEMIMIPKQLGEVAAFGGSNIEPSVRSCFEFAKSANEITLNNFLEWLKLEPQSIVWLPVMHRLAAAETARHDAKCSICKEYPIVGFRYRSLKHFNFDICQNCFFSGRKIKGFKFDHPLLEYYTPTSSSDDIKDFFRIFRNKFKSKRARRSSKLGYLPVQSVLEGDEFECPKAAPEQETSKKDAESVHAVKQVQIMCEIDQQNLEKKKLYQQQQLAQKQQQQQQQQQQQLIAQQIAQKQLQQQALQQQQQIQAQQQVQQQIQPPLQSQPQQPQQPQQPYATNSINRNASVSPTRQLAAINTSTLAYSTVQKPYTNGHKKTSQTSSNIKLNDSDEEHMLIAKICSSLSSESSSAERTNQQKAEFIEKIQNTLNIEGELGGDDLNQQQELENIIRDLEEENTFLIEEYTRLQSQLATSSNKPTVSGTSDYGQLAHGKSVSSKASTLQHYGHRSKHYNKQIYEMTGVISAGGAGGLNMPTGSTMAANYSIRALSSSPTPHGSSSVHLPQMYNASANYASSFYPVVSNASLNSVANNGTGAAASMLTNNPYNRVPLLFSTASPTSMLQENFIKSDKDSQILAEARALRQHEDRLEARMKILENHNRLLDTQLKQLKNLLNNANQYKESRQSRATSAKLENIRLENTKLINVTTQQQQSASLNTKRNIGNLFHNVEDITRAINNLNNLVSAMGNAETN